MTSKSVKSALQKIRLAAVFEIVNIVAQYNLNKRKKSKALI